MAYATIADLENRWRALSPDEAVVAAQLLEDAAVILTGSAGSNVDDSILSIVSCNMVRRAMTTSGDAFGLDGQTMPSAGWGTMLPAGDLWLSAQDRRMISGSALIGTAKMEIL